MSEDIFSPYEPVIGLEIHAQLFTHAKIFSSDAVEFGDEPNTHISSVTLGHPGVLPVLNKMAVEFALRMGLATNCEINRYCYFARKNYFYPDLPKGYQITQDKTPVCINGKIKIRLKNGTEKEIGIQRIHLEEDAGKSIHDQDLYDTLVDFNRCGAPLIEIVSAPDLRSGEEAYVYVSEIRKLVRYLQICDGNMEEGSLRCDANISVRKKGGEKFGVKVEVKNMNSIRNVQRAINYEIQRQIEAIGNGEKIFQETRTFDAERGITISMRSKETAHDYRYFPEPDLPPLKITDEMLHDVRRHIPALPQELFKKYVTEFGLPEFDAQVLTEQKEVSKYFEEIIKYANNYKAASNWMIGPVKSFLNEHALDISEFKVKPKSIAEIIQLADEGKISSTAAKEIFSELLENPRKSATEIANEKNLIQNQNVEELKTMAAEVLKKYPDKVIQYKEGKKGLLGLFVGEVMKASSGRADPKITSQIIEELLTEK